VGPRIDLVAMTKGKPLAAPKNEKNPFTDSLFAVLVEKQRDLDVCSTTKMCTSIQNVLLHIFNYQFVSIAFVIIFRVALQGYSENKLPTFVSRTTKRYNRYLTHSIWSQIVSFYIIKANKI
jgi:hypothetical protein